MENITTLLDTTPSWVVIALCVLVSTFLLLVLKRVILVRLERWISKTSYKLDTLFVHALSFPVTILVFCINLFLLKYLLEFYDITDGSLTQFVKELTQILLIVAGIIFLDKFLEGVLGDYASKSSALSNSKSIVQGIAHIVIIGIGVLVIMGTMGISITPIIASLGITSLAVALALQPTLENFFSGIQLVMDKPFRIGDFIELESGEQGFVEKIGWRSTWVRMLPNNTIIMPNSILSQSKIINYFYPEKELSVPVEVGVHYDSDLEHVERVTLEVAREILISHEWGVDDYNTFVIFHTFDNSSINFTVMLRAREYFNRFWVKSAFIKALHKRYAQEGITIPYPIRAINLDQENARPITVTSG